MMKWLAKITPGKSVGKIVISTPHGTCVPAISWFKTKTRSLGLHTEL